MEENKKEKIVGGKNGFGFKLVLIWSSWGSIETVDHTRQLKYVQEFKHNLDEIRVEAISAFQAFTQELRRTTNLPIKEITSVKDKISRLVSVSYLFENHKVFISNSIQSEVREELITQLINNNPDHDDLRDALVGALEDNKKEFNFFVL